MRSTARVALAALALMVPFFAPGVAQAQEYVYAPPPPPPPPPPAYAPYPRYERVTHEPRTNAFDLGFDLEGVAPLNIPTLPDGNRIQGGSGFKLRLGDQIRIGRNLRITPEGGYAYAHLFAADDYGNAFAWDMDRFFGGVRFAFGQIVVPSVYGHLGVGWRMTGDPYLSSAGGFAADVGGALDVRVWRRFQLGAHIEYATIDVSPYAPQWLALGGQIDLVF